MFLNSWVHHLAVWIRHTQLWLLVSDSKQGHPISSYSHRRGGWVLLFCVEDPPGSSRVCDIVHNGMYRPSMTRTQLFQQTVELLTNMLLQNVDNRWTNKMVKHQMEQLCSAQKVQPPCKKRIIRECFPHEDRRIECGLCPSKRAQDKHSTRNCINMVHFRECCKVSTSSNFVFFHNLRHWLNDWCRHYK